MQYMRSLRLDTIYLPPKLLEKLCPDCLREAMEMAEVEMARERRKRERIVEREGERMRRREQKVTSIFFSIILIAATLIFCYSFLTKFPQLPNFRFEYYIIAHFMIGGLISFLLLRPSQKFLIANGIIWVLILIGLWANFGIKGTLIFIPVFSGISLVVGFVHLLSKWPTARTIVILTFIFGFCFSSFRNAFYSYFDNWLWMVIATVLFLGSLCVESLAVSMHTEQRITSRFQSQLIRSYTPFFICLIVCFAFLSPFHFGAIKINPLDLDTVETYHFDEIYEERMLHGGTETDHEISRQYFLDGREKAASGNIAGFLDAIKFYRKSIELIPDFSTAYVEMAYSYSSIGRILKETQKNSKAEKNFVSAEDCIRKAEGIRSKNPSILAVKAILEFYTKNKNNAYKHLNKAKELAEQHGYSDRILQVMGILNKKRVDKVRFLKTAHNIRPNDAELHNFLGIACYLINDKKSAKKMFERATKNLNPNYGEAYLNLALVYPAKERAELYKKAADKDPDFMLVATNYLRVLDIQKWLKRFYWFLLGLFIIHFFILFELSYRRLDLQTNTVILKVNRRIKIMFFSYVFIFICTYGLFELYIHILYPINTPNHMFPVSFPFL